MEVFFKRDEPTARERASKRSSRAHAFRSFPSDVSPTTDFIFPGYDLASQTTPYPPLRPPSPDSHPFPFSSSSFVLPLRLRTNDGHAWTLAPSLPSLPSFDSSPLTQFGSEWILPWTRSRNDVQLVSSQIPEIYLRSFLIQVVFFGREGKGPGSC